MGSRKDFKEEEEREKKGKFTEEERGGERSVDDVLDTPHFSGRFLLAIHLFRDVRAASICHDGGREGFGSSEKAKVGR